jgi:two-component system sensor kinase FixL
MWRWKPRASNRAYRRAVCLESRATPDRRQFQSIPFRCYNGGETPHISLISMPSPLPSPSIFSRFQDLQKYVGWSAADAANVRSVAQVIEAGLFPLIDDFYTELQQHPESMRVITGGTAQIERLKESLRRWLRDSLKVEHDAEYVARRWTIGLRHAEIGLHPAYTSAALARLRNGIIRLVVDSNSHSTASLGDVVQSLNRLLDLDLLVIHDAYEAEHVEKEKLAEHERSEVKFRRLVEAAACLVLILDAQRKIVYCSPFGEELTGHKVADLMGQDFLQTLVSPTARADMAAEIDASFAGRLTRGSEHPILRRDGTQRWLVWNSQRLENYEGVPAVLAVGHDFTERRIAHERMLRSERLAGIGQMITGLAHESRNALQRIQSCSEMLELEVENNEEAMRLLRRLQSAQDDLRRLLDEVRSFAAPIKLECSDCDLASTWREAWRLLENDRRGRDAALEEPSEVRNLTIQADRFRLVQIFRNLLENSLAACKDPVRINIRCIEVAHNGDRAVTIAVQDNGPGLTADVRANVFEPFFTTKTKGTGLGMAIARQVVDAHGGRIELGTAAGGAEFIITLPRNAP